jgi:hypothetical protein
MLVAGKMIDLIDAVYPNRNSPLLIAIRGWVHVIRVGDDAGAF